MPDLPLGAGWLVFEVARTLCANLGGMLDEYGWATEVGIEPIDWQHHGREWQSRLHQCLDETGLLQREGSRFDETTKPFLQIRARQGDESCHAHLLVAPLPEGGAVTIVAAPEEPDQVVIDAWVTAVRCATARLGAPAENYRWSAIVGHPPVRISGVGVVLASESRVGPFTLRSSDQELLEAGPMALPSLSGWAMFRSWPIIVEGVHVGYNWTAASAAVALDLHRLCGLLSLLFEECFVIREAPAPLDWGIRRVPSSLPWQQWDRYDETSVDRPTGQELPGWTEEAWSRLVNSPPLLDAVAAHHEGLRARVEHPSLALVAFIASIEAVANMLFSETRCPTCQAHRFVTRRFRATVRLVATEEEAAVLGRAYQRRSMTVHRGTLHGSEATAGALPEPDPWSSDPVWEFEWGVLEAMRRASQHLLVEGLTGNLPPKGSLAEPWSQGA